MGLFGLIQMGNCFLCCYSNLYGQDHDYVEHLCILAATKCSKIVIHDWNTKYRGELLTIDHYLQTLYGLFRGKTYILHN